MKLISDLLFGILFCISLGGLGGLFARRILDLKTNFFMAFFFGCGLAIVFLFLGGLFGIFSSTFFLIFIILALLFAISGWRRLAKWQMNFNKKELVLIALVIIVLLLAGLASLSPPLKNDTLYYHLGLPKLWAGDGGIHFYPTIALSATALNGELLVTPIVGRISPEAAQFIVFLIGVITMLLLAEELNRFVGANQYLGLLFLAAVPLYISGLADGKNDYLAAGFCLVSTFLYFDYLKARNAKYLILAGVFAGLAAGTKTNCLIFVMSITILTVFGRPRFKDLLLFILGILIFGAPWYLRAFIITGNPVYPFYNTIFHSGYWRDIFDGFNQAAMPVSEKRNPANFILSPFKLVYLPDLFRGRLGPLPFILLPLFIFIKNHPRFIHRALWISAIFYAAWFSVWANARYLLPAAMLLIFVSSYIAYRSFKFNRTVGLAIIIGASLIVMVNIAQMTRDGLPRIKAALGLVDRDTFLLQAAVLDPNNLGSDQKTAALPYYEVWQVANASLPNNAVVGILCSNWSRADGFYLDRRFLYLNPSEQTAVDFSQDEGNIIRTLTVNKIDHLLIDNRVIAEFSDTSQFKNIPAFAILAAGVKTLADYAKENGQLVFQADRFTLYRLR